MTNAKTFVIALVAVVIAACAFLFPQASAPLGANPGPDFLNDVNFRAEVINSATVATSSAASANLLPGNLVCGGSLMVSLPVGSVTLTLPATSTLSAKVPTAGSRCSLAIVNASTTASQNVTIAAGTGWKLATTTAAQGVIFPGTVGVVEFVRKANSDITATIYNQALAQ
jgi:hypothetical protein